MPLVVWTLLLLCGFCGTVDASSIRTAAVVPSSLSGHMVGQYRISPSQMTLSRRGFRVDYAISTSASPSTPEGMIVSISPDMPGLTASTSGRDGQYLVTLVLPCNAPVGTFYLRFATSSSPTAWFRVPVPLVVLFNPYAPCDETYIPDMAAVGEYIGNEYGLVWRGTLRSKYAMRWFYGQFDPSALQVTLSLLSSFNGDRSSAREVSRWLTFAHTYQKGNPRGLLVGAWDMFTAARGVNPNMWSSSTAIFRAYANSGNRPVKFAQCWVFAGALTSSFRALGIPARQITAFNSAHMQAIDTGGSVFSHEFRRYFNRGGRMVSQDGTIWNFHSWVEVWINRRTDLDSAGHLFGGWQVMDSTPQEPSAGAYRTGPASVNAVHGQRDNMPYDTSFVISEVASKIHNVVVDCTQSFRSTGCRVIRSLGTPKGGIGDLLVTKAIGDTRSFIDITSAYHPPINVNNPHNPSYSDSGVVLRGVTAKMGSPISILGVFYSKPTEHGFGRRINFVLHCYHTDYTLRNMTRFKTIWDWVTLDKQNNFTTSYMFTITEYYDMWPMPDYVYCTAFGQANDTESVWVKDISVHLQAPRLELMLASHNLSHVSQPIRVTVFLGNALPVTLTNMQLQLTGYHLGLDEELHLGALAPQDSVTATRYVRGEAENLGAQSIIGTFSCDQFTTESFVDLAVT